MRTLELLAMARGHREQIHLAGRGTDPLETKSWTSMRACPFPYRLKGSIHNTPPWRRGLFRSSTEARMREGMPWLAEPPLHLSSGPEQATPQQSLPKGRMELTPRQRRLAGGAQKARPPTSRFRLPRRRHRRRPIGFQSPSLCAVSLESTCVRLAAFRGGSYAVEMPVRPNPDRKLPSPKLVEEETPPHDRNLRLMFSDSADCLVAPSVLFRPVPLQTTI
mmetsp:Transcript_26650/g.63206  ORF Transcript_26650/g.63206 Transcript_26650/m.63206 type:complete len:220 (-) Transcript_26650:1098-1757(-)